MPTDQAKLVLRHIRRAVLADQANLSDGQLLDCFIGQRDERAFAALVKRHGPMVWGVCRRLLRSHQDAEDAFQATFLVLVRKATAIVPREMVGNWLYGVAFQTAVRARSMNSKRRTRERHIETIPEPETADRAGCRDLLPLLDQALARLPDKYRAPVVLCDLEGKSYQEAARQLGCPAGTLGARLSRARALLAKQLARHGLCVSAATLAAALAQSRASASIPALVLSSTIRALTSATANPAAGLIGSRAEVLAEGVVKTMFLHKLKGMAAVLLLLGLALGGAGFFALHSPAEATDARPGPLPPLVRSARSGPWTDPATWEGGNVPGAGARVQVRPKHTVVYDRSSDQVVRSIHVAGTLRFAADRDTRLDVGLIKVQPGEDASENGFDCDAHLPQPGPDTPRPALEVGTPAEPIPARHSALIRLTYCEGLDRESCPAIVCCGGRMDLHGAALSRTWVRLGPGALKGDTTLTLDEPVAGWRVGDRLIVTATRFFRSDETRRPRTGVGCASEKIIRAVDGTRITLDRPLEEEHQRNMHHRGGARDVNGEFRAQVANLSRNVVIESADPAGVRGHTMYHRGSAGSISYAEFRHLGKPGVLGRYPIHYHLVGDTMRGSSVVGASVWDSGNRWVTIHGTNYLVVRDCVGYLSKGHGFYLEDGTEVFNVLDRNLAVQAYAAKMLPKQALPFDHNQAAGFWWANCLNTFTRNVACGNEVYGYRFEATPSKTFDLNLPVRQADGSRRKIDIRTLPFVRFEGNESHHNGHYGVNIGEGVDRVGPDHRHPLVIRNLTIWGEGYGFRPQSPSMLVENLRIGPGAYGVYHPNYDHHVYRNVYISGQAGEAFNRGHDDDSVQYGPLTVEGLTFDDCGTSKDGTGGSLIQISDHNPTGTAVSHFKNVKVVNYGSGNPRVLVNRGSGPRPEPKTEKGVPVYLHDWFGPGKTAKVVSTKARDKDGLNYREQYPLTGDESRVAECKDIEFPKLLDPVDDLPPATVITHVLRSEGKLVVRGTTSDNGKVTKVAVNGHEARSVSPNFAEWEAILTGVRPGEVRLEARASDAAGNVEPRPHVLVVNVSR